MFFDTHAHYDDDQFDPDRDEILSSMTSGGIGWIVNPSCSEGSCRKSCAIAEKYPFVYFAAGIHPEDVDEAGENCLDTVEQYLDHPKAVAVGEIGLDYHYGRENADKQKALFRAQLDISRRRALPALVHIRDATADGMEILRDHKDVQGVLHCFSGSWETAKDVLDMGWYISFTGVVTFKNARKAQEVVRNMPLDRLMLETDSPYMAPVPHRGERCSSLFVPLIAKTVADIRGISVDDVERITTENALRFFGIK